jgi:hypothetical protein
MSSSGRTRALRRVERSGSFALSNVFSAELTGGESRSDHRVTLGATDGLCGDLSIESVVDTDSGRSGVEYASYE